MTTLDDEIAAYEKMKDKLEAEHLDKWVVFHGGELIGTYKTNALAANDAIRRFGRGPYLVKQVGARPRTLPASVWLRRVHG